MTLLEIAIRKQLKNFRLEAELSLEEEEGQVLVLFGPSGSGKTLTLKCIAGVEQPDAGYIEFGGRAVYDSAQRLNLKMQQRNVGYLPQNYALFPHLNVVENIGYGLFAWPTEKRQKRVQELLRLMQLEGLEKSYPRQLSGGQQQRVGFARALAPEPDILLLDEPFSALDSAIRAELRQNLALLSRDLRLPVVFITHDLEEAYMLADRIAVYQQGKILQFARREEVFYRPLSQQVARMVGIHNLWEGRVMEVRAEERLVLVRTVACDLWASLPPTKEVPVSGQHVTVCLRPEHVSLSASPSPFSPLNQYEAQIVREVSRGSLYTLYVRLGSIESVTEAHPVHDFEAELTAQSYHELVATGGTHYLRINPPDIHLIW